MPYQFKIQLKNITKPPVWRRVLVPEAFSFEEFHVVIQIAFGWENYHLYQFSETGYTSGEVIGIVEENPLGFLFDGPRTRDASQVPLSEVFGEVGQTYTYIYDFGDDWIHHITLEAITDTPIASPQLMAAKGACPPEDCGGPWGYENLKIILADPKHPEHKEMKKWLGLKPRQQWDPNFVDVAEIKEIFADF